MAGYIIGQIGRVEFCTTRLESQLYKPLVSLLVTKIFAKVALCKGCAKVANHLFVDLIHGVALHLIRFLIEPSMIAITERHQGAPLLSQTLHI